MASPIRDRAANVAGKMLKDDDSVFDLTMMLSNVEDGTSQIVVGSDDDVATVTLSLDTGAYADGDVLADTQTMGALFRANGGTMILHSVQVFDLDDNAGALTLVFLNANTSLGSENSAPSITDANMTNIVATVRVYSSDYVDFTNSQVAEVGNIGKLIEAASAADDLYIAALSNDTKTYTASGIKVRVGLLRN